MQFAFLLRIYDISLFAMLFAIDTDGQSSNSLENLFFGKNVVWLETDRGISYVRGAAN